MGLLDGKSAIVTGGGQGIGRGVALALATEGSGVALLGRTQATLDKVCAEIGERGGTAISHVCDVRSGDQIRDAVTTVAQELGGIDILVNNAQTTKRGFLLDIDDADVEDLWSSGPLAVLRMMRECHPYLRGNGVIINMSSVAAYGAAPKGTAIYGAVKAAIGSLTRSAAVEWGSDGIRVVAVVPLAETETFGDYQRRDPEGSAARIAALPLGRLGHPEHDVGRAVVFLVGPDAAMITGTTLTVDAGLLYLR